MKSVLVIDKSECCDMCVLCINQVCTILKKPIITDEIYRIDKECPLKDLPQKQVCNERDFEKYVNGYGKGWNDCLGHITGEYNHYVPEKYTEENS